MLYICFFIYNSIQKRITEEEIALIVYVVFFVLIIVVVFVTFFVTFQKRKNQLLLENIEQQKKFDEELLLTQQEIQEETLKNVGRELHDNIGQLLAFSTMQMNAVAKAVPDEVKSKVSNASDSLKESLAAVRSLSKSLNNDVLSTLSFESVLQNEVERLNKSGLIEVELKISGCDENFENKKDQIILFRMIQEFFSNTLKYAQAEHIDVLLNYNEQELSINIKDDGVGFDINKAEKGSGLINIHKRAELINAKLELKSQLEQGTSLHILYPYR
ncbi:histidine kinase [Winogradskyella sp. SYSU M77433]|uniref:sensor histidine kinase n=1 Tax=Winogradskyella sp. SYSU M77433 TaxID=3042722 RepID=UPI0024809FEF|nr:histidine kinase [Winogradskyella sp. SYSU M77433]MDH7912429.1 histidine kinase [Winogradskyella sp. SYSU M77433]